MRIDRLFALVAIAAGTSFLSPALHAQGLDELRGNWLPVFTSSPEGQKAELYAYYPSLDLMVRLEATATPGLFNNLEFGYLVGDFYADVSELLAASWYRGQDAATLISAAQRLETEEKLMQQPFQQPGATLAVAMDEEGLSFTYTGRSATGVGEASWTLGVTWAEIAAQR